MQILMNKLPHHHHHIALVARISLTLSRHSSLSFIALGRSSGQHPVSSHSCWMYVRAGRPAFARPCVGVHKSTSLMSSSLLLQQCPACLVHSNTLFIYHFFCLHIVTHTHIYILSVHINNRQTYTHLYHFHPLFSLHIYTIIFIQILSHPHTSTKYPFHFLFIKTHALIQI